MNTSRFVNTVFTFLFAGVALFAAIFLYRDYQHLDHARKQKALMEQRLATLQKESDTRQTRIDRLKRDPEYMEQVIREKLDYAKKDEVVFRFE